MTTSRERTVVWYFLSSQSKNIHVIDTCVFDDYFFLVSHLRSEVISDRNPIVLRSQPKERKKERKKRREREREREREDKTRDKKRRRS